MLQQPLSKVTRTSYVLDSRKKLFEIRFFENNQVGLSNYNHQALISLFTSYDKLPAWIKHNMDSAEAIQVVSELK